MYYTNPHECRLNTDPFYRKCGKKNRGLVHRKTHCVTVHLMQGPPSYRLPHGSDGVPWLNKANIYLFI